MRFVFLNRSGLLHIPTRFGRIGGACTARTSVGAAAGAMIPKHASATGRNRPPTRPPPTRRVIFMNNCSDIHQLVGGAAESRSQPSPLCRNSHLFDVHYYQPPVRRNALHVRCALPPNFTVLQHHSICSPVSGLSTVGSCRDQCRTRPIDRQFSVVLASPDGAASMTRLSRLVYFWGLPWVTHSLRLRLRRGERGRRSQARPTRLMSPLPMGQETSPSATVGDGRPNHGSTLRRQSPAGGTTL